MVNKTIPPKIIGQMDLLANALRQCPDLLEKGRAYGLQIGLSSQLQVLILEHNKGKELIHKAVSNTVEINRETDS